MTTPISGHSTSVAPTPTRSTASRPTSDVAPQASQASQAGETQRPPSEPARAVTAVAVPDEQNSNETIEQVRAAIEELRAQVRNVRRELDFHVDEDSGRTIITVLNAETGEVVRQIPPEETLQLIQDMSNGKANLISNQA